MRLQDLEDVKRARAQRENSVLSLLISHKRQSTVKVSFSSSLHANDALSHETCNSKLIDRVEVNAD